ncbi:MAG: tetratricopeptide repeat protein, partial [Planctomycetaceae bacterium]
MRARLIARWILPLGLVAAVALGTLWWQRRTHPEDQFAQALVAFAAKDYERVSELRKDLEDRSAFQQHARLLTGAVLLRQKKYDLAHAELTTVTPRGALRNPALEWMGECLYRMGRIAEAEPLMRQLATENPDHANAHRWLGAIYFDLGANDLATAEFEIVARIAPQDYRPHWMIGLMYFDFERFPQAIEHYRTALKLCPQVPVRGVIVRGLARSLIAEREFQAALDVL